MAVALALAPWEEVAQGQRRAQAPEGGQEVEGRWRVVGEPVAKWVVGVGNSYVVVVAQGKGQMEGVQFSRGVLGSPLLLLKKTEMEREEEDWKKGP